MRAIGIAIPFIKRRSGVTIDAQAQAHYNRVIADGGVVPSGLSGVNAFFSAIKTIYATADITTAISAAYDPQYLGYKLGAGSGTTLGQAAQKLYSCSGASGDVIQTTAASQPLLLAHNGASTDNYWFGSGLIGNVINTSTTLIATTQLDVSAYVIASAGHTVAATIFSNDGTARNFVFNCLDVSTGILQLRAGTPFNNYNSTVGVGNFDDYTGWIRATYTQNGLNGEVRFYKSSDSKNTPYLSLNWIQLGSVVTIASTGLQNGTNSIQIGANQGSNSFTGKIGRATIATTIGGAPVIDFNPNQYNPATSQTQWTSTTGEVWTVLTGTANGYKGLLVDKTVIQGDGIDDILRVSSLPSKQYFSVYLATNGLSSAGNVALFNGDVGDRHLIFQASAASITAFNGTSLAFVGEVANRLYLATVNFNNTSSDTLYNNANKQTGATGTGTSTGYCLLGGTGNAFSNQIFNTLLATSSVNTTAQNTDVYNYIRSINNNAF